MKCDFLVQTSFLSRFNSILRTHLAEVGWGAEIVPLLLEHEVTDLLLGALLDHALRVGESEEKVTESARMFKK